MRWAYELPLSAYQSHICGCLTPWYGSSTFHSESHSLCVLKEMNGFVDSKPGMKDICPFNRRIIVRRWHLIFVDDIRIV
jgi:hypothetical protein